MPIMILFHDSGYRCLKHFYLEYDCKHMRHLFHRVFSYKRFVEFERDVAVSLTLFVKKGLLGKCSKRGRQGISRVICAKKEWERNNPILSFSYWEEEI